MIDLWLLFWTFFRIGLIGFGGGYSIISLLMSELQNLSISIKQFSDLLALDMLVPGPIATNAATYMGFIKSGVGGALAATIGISLPSYFLIFSLRHFLSKYKESTYVKGALDGSKSAAVGLIVSAGLSIALEEIISGGRDSLLAFDGNTISLAAIVIFVAVYAVSMTKKINPILLTLLGGVAGALFVRS